MFQIDAPLPPMTKSAFVDETQDVCFTDWTRADRAKRQTIEALQACDSVFELDAYMNGESLLIDALFFYDPDMAADIDVAAAEHRAHLEHGAASYLRQSANPHRADPGQQRQERQPMFKIDAQTGGESGPFLNYKNRAGQGMPDGSWYLRERPEGADNWTYTDMTDTMRGGFVADMFATHDGQLGGTLKMGYVFFKEDGAPDRAWWASPLQSEQRPDESKGAGGGYNWQNAVQFRVAIGGGKSALFDVSGWSGYKGVAALLQSLNTGFANNIGKCPLVQYTGFRVEGTGQKRLHVPEFTVADWVDRPACLTPDAPQIAPAPAEVAQPAQQAPATQPTQQAAPSSAVPANAAF